MNGSNTNKSPKGTSVVEVPDLRKRSFCGWYACGHWWLALIFDTATLAILATSCVTLAAIASAPGSQWFKQWSDAIQILARSCSRCEIIELAGLAGMAALWILSCFFIVVGVLMALITRSFLRGAFLLSSVLHLFIVVKPWFDRFGLAFRHIH